MKKSPTSIAYTRTKKEIEKCNENVYKTTQALISLHRRKRELYDKLVMLQGLMVTENMVN